MRVDVGTAEGVGGSTVEIEIYLDAGERQVARVMHDVIFDPELVSIVSPAVDCRINPEIGAAQDGCLEEPQIGPCKSLLRSLATCPTSGCPAHLGGRKRLHGSIESVANDHPIPNGLLYTCRFRLEDTVSASTVLLNLNIQTYAPNGSPLPSAGLDGAIVIVVPPHSSTD